MLVNEFFDDPREARWRMQQAQQPAAPQPPKSIWNRAFKEGAKGSALHNEAVTARLRIAWRITRFLSILQGRIQPDEPLNRIESIDSDHLYTVTPEAVSALPARFAGTALTRSKIPIVPPRPNGFASKQENLAAEKIYLEFMDVIQNFRKIFTNVIAPKDPWSDQDNWFGILDPTKSFLLYPEFSEIVIYEEQLIQKVLDHQVAHGLLKTQKRLRYKYMLSIEEANFLNMLARRTARQLLEMDQEDERAMMTLRLQDHQQRAKQAFNLREELQGLKQEAVVRGLTKTQPEGFMDVFARVVDETSKDMPRPAAQLAQHVQPAPEALEDTDEDTEDEED